MISRFNLLVRNTCFRLYVFFRQRFQWQIPEGHLFWGGEGGDAAFSPFFYGVLFIDSVA